MAPIIAVTGQIAAGKTTFARALGLSANIPTVDIRAFDGDWRAFEAVATRFRGSVITESVALPAWRDVLIYCVCDELVRQARLGSRGDGPREPLAKYDFSSRADLIVDTTRKFDLTAAFPLIRGRSNIRPASETSRSRAS